MSDSTASVQDNTLNAMLNKSVGPLIIKMAVPTIISMMVTAIYNMADTFFVSKLGTSASGAVGITFSIMAIIQAFGFTIGMGSGSILSRKLGARNIKSADEFCSTGIITAFVTGTIIAILGVRFNGWIVIHLGATVTIAPYARDYARYILLGAPFMVTSFVMNNQLRFQGKAAFSMVGLTLGGILNIILDPIFIFVFNLGISGAAIATLISQIVSFSILLSWFLRRKTSTTLSPKNLSHNPKVYLEIFKQGLPSLLRQGLASVSTIFLNVTAAKYGALAAAGMAADVISHSADAAVAGMSITNRVFMFIMSIAIGLGQGFQPVCGMNYGAKRYDRVRDSYMFLVKVTTSVMSVFTIIVLLFAPQIIQAFRNDPEVIAMGRVAMRWQGLFLPLHSVIFGTNMLLQTTGMAKQASLLSSMRQGLYFIPLIWILPLCFGIFGVQIAQGTSDFLTACTSLPFAIHFFKGLKKED